MLNTILGGVVHVAAEPEPAREARLHLRRDLVVRHAAFGRARSSRAAGVQTDKTAEALQGVLQRADAHPASRFRPTSSTKAKNYVALGFPGEFETTGDMARKIEELVVYHLPDDYFSSYVADREAVTAADVQRVARPLHSARQVRGRHRRRSQGDRAGHPRAESRTDREPDGRTGAGADYENEERRTRTNRTEDGRGAERNWTHADSLAERTSDLHRRGARKVARVAAGAP